MSKHQRRKSETNVDATSVDSAWLSNLSRAAGGTPDGAHNPQRDPTVARPRPRPFPLAAGESPIDENRLESRERTTRHADEAHREQPRGHHRSRSAFSGSHVASPMHPILTQPFTVNWNDPYHFVSAQGLTHDLRITIDGISRTIVTLMHSTYRLSTRSSMRTFESDGGRCLDHLLEETQDVKQRFSETLPSYHSIKVWIESLQRCGRFPDSLPIVAFEFLYRLTRDNSICLLPSNWKGFLTTAFLLAQKSLDDNCFDVIHFHKMTPQFSVCQLQQMELAFLTGIHFNLEVDADRYAELYRLFWLEYHNQTQQASRTAPTGAEDDTDEDDGLELTACVSGPHPSVRETQRSDAGVGHQRNQSTGAMTWQG
jgi:hypothetical protein